MCDCLCKSAGAVAPCYVPSLDTIRACSNVIVASFALKRGFDGTIRDACTARSPKRAGSPRMAPSVEEARLSQLEASLRELADVRPSPLPPRVNTHAQACNTRIFLLGVALRLLGFGSQGHPCYA